MRRKAMILAAGLGTRMRPLTDTLPKPLLKVGGKSMLDRAFDHLDTVGISEIVVNSHHLASLTQAAVKQRAPHAILSREDTLLETGGGVKHALPHLGREAFFILNGDCVWEGSESLKALNDLWNDDVMDALLLLIPLENAVGYTGTGDFFLENDNKLRRRESEPKAPYVYAGIQLIHPRLFDGAPEGPFSFNLLWDKALQEGRLYGAVHKGNWFHVGTPQDLQEVDSLLS